MTAIQILEFKVKNYRSFLREQTFCFSDDGSTARRVTAVFGANASGKSNMVLALKAFRYMILESTKETFRLPYDPFKFQKNCKDAPTDFFIKFRSDNMIFTYAISYDATKILFEELRQKSENTNHYHTIFSRDAKKQLSSGAKNFGFTGKIVENTRDDSLLILKPRENNNPFSEIIYNLANSILIVEGHDNVIERVAIEVLKMRPELRQKAVEYLGKADFSIKSIQLEKQTKDPRHQSVVQTLFGEITDMQVGHYYRDGLSVVRDEANHPTVVNGPLSSESNGTRYFLSILVPLLAALEGNGILIVDEFGTYLSSILAFWTVRLMRSESEKTAQFIFNSHIESLMDKQGNNERVLSGSDIILLDKTHITEETIVTPYKDRANARVVLSGRNFRNGDYGGTANLLPGFEEQ